MSKGYYALVTGGTSGMGLEYVKQLAGRGYNVIIAALPEKKDEKGNPAGKIPGPEYVAEELSAQFPELDFIPVAIDLARESSAEELVDRIFRSRPDARIDVLINNAGAIKVDHFRNLSDSYVKVDVMLHNLTTARLCRLLLPAMEERKRGYVLNVSSLAAWLPFPFISTYSASKAYIRTLTNALRTEYYRTGVNVATIYFGAVDTPLFNLNPGKRRIARALKVMIKPQKAASTALKMLFSGHSGYMPGFVNKLARVICPLIPRRIIFLIDRKVSERLGIK